MCVSKMMSVEIKTKEKPKKAAPDELEQFFHIINRLDHEQRRRLAFNLSSLCMQSENFFLIYECNDKLNLKAPLVTSQFAYFACCC